MSEDPKMTRRGPTLLDESTKAEPSRRGPTLIDDVEALPDAPDATEAPDVDAPPAEATATWAAIALASMLGQMTTSTVLSKIMAPSATARSRPT